jgi:Fe-S-cluster-containing hydrogenase component 2
MKRKIIQIDEELCNGCGECIPNCPEGALQIIDQKARLVSDLFCDGLGACIGNCPLGAIEVVEREAEAYSEEKVMQNIIKQGPNTIKAHLAHLKDHGENELYNQALNFLKKNNLEIPLIEEKEEEFCGCMGSAPLEIKREAPEASASIPVQSVLTTWPVQLHLLNPNASYLKNADLLVAADCVGFAFADFHQRFLKGKVPIIFCPKLDNSTEVYLEKLTHIFKVNEIKSVTIVKMEVPCCGGTTALVEESLRRSGTNTIIKEYTIGINGEIL